MADDNKLIFEGVLDTSNMEKQVDALAKKKSKAVSGEIISAKDVDNAKKLEQQIGNAETKFKQLANAQSNFASGTNQSAAAFAKVTQQMAGQVKYLADKTTDQQKFNQLVAKEVELRKQARDTLASTKAPTGPSTNLANMGGGGGGGGLQLPGLNASTLAGGVFGAALGAGAAAVKAFGDAVGEAGKKAQELAKGFSDAQGKFGALYQSQLNKSYEESKLAHNPVVLDLEKAKNDFETGFKKAVGQTLTDFKNGLDDLAHSGDKGGVDANRAKRAKEAERALATPGQLVGSDKIQYDQLKRQGIELEQDLAREKVKLDHDFMKQHRDLAMEENEFEIQQARKKQELEIAGARENRNYDHDMARLTADFEFKQGEKKYQLDLAAEKRNFDLKQGDERQLAQFAKQDREQQATFATQDRNRQLGKTLSRNAQDYQEDLLKGAISGSLGGTDYLFKAMDFRKQQSRLIEDTKIEQEQANRNLGFENTKAQRDLGFKQGTERRDFSLGQGDKAAQHKLDVETHLYQVKEAEYQLTTKHTDAIQDNIRALNNLAEDTDIQHQKFKNRESDLAFDEKTARQDYEINATRGRRSIQESKQEFAAGLYGKDPYGFDKIEQGNRDLGNDLAGYLDRAGLPGYVNQVDVELQKFRKNRGNYVPTNIGDVSSQQGGYAQPGGGNGNTPIFQDTNVYDNQGNWIGDHAANGMPIVDRDKPVFVHRDEAILTPPQADQWRKTQNLSGTNILDMSPMGGNRNIGAGYGPGGGTGLVQLTGNLSNASANGAPININVGKDTFNFNGGGADIQKQVEALRQEYLSKIASLQTYVTNSQQQTLQIGRR